jgi:hypothetical protein
LRKLILDHGGEGWGSGVGWEAYKFPSKFFLEMGNKILKRIKHADIGRKLQLI